MCRCRKVEERLKDFFLLCCFLWKVPSRRLNGKPWFLATSLLCITFIQEASQPSSTWIHGRKLGAVPGGHLVNLTVTSHPRHHASASTHHKDWISAHQAKTCVCDMLPLHATLASRGSISLTTLAVPGCRGCWFLPKLTTYPAFICFCVEADPETRVCIQVTYKGNILPVTPVREWGEQGQEGEEARPGAISGSFCPSARPAMELWRVSYSLKLSQPLHTHERCKRSALVLPVRRAPVAKGHFSIVIYKCTPQSVVCYRNDIRVSRNGPDFLPCLLPLNTELWPLATKLSWSDLVLPSFEYNVIV